MVLPGKYRWYEIVRSVTTENQTEMTFLSLIRFHFLHL
jgi:hypothetical protein